MAGTPGTFRFPEVNATPPAPPAGYALLYIKTDNVLYLQDASGVEIALGSSSSITSLTGEATAVGPGAAAVTLSNAAVIAKVLTGFTAGPNSVVLATDSILQGLQKLQAQVSGTAGTAITALTGDVSATGPGSSAATVNSVGGSSAANIHSAELLANAATALNTASAIVKRDGAGGFAAAALVITSVAATGTSDIVQAIVKGFTTQTSDIFQVLKSDNTVLFKVDNAGVGTFLGNIVAANFNGTFSGTTSGTNTGDVTKSDTNSIALTLVGQLLSADLKISTDPADAGNVKATTTVHAGVGAAQGLHVEVPFGNPVQIGTSNNPGSASTVSLSDHVHAITIGVIGNLVLTGYTIGANAIIAATDTIFQALGKLQGQISAISGSAITALTGDVTATGPGSVTATIAVGAVTDTKASLANKPAVTVVATTNQALSGAPTIDGQATTAGTSIALLTAQSTASENGPWVVQSGAWTRPTWFPNGGTTQAFQFITTLVRLGTVYQGSTWRMTTAGAVTIGTTATTWVVTPQSGNFKDDFVLGPQSGSSPVTLAFANAFKAILSWNPTANFTLTLPPTQGAAGTVPVNDGTGIITWTNPNTNIDGGTANSVYTPTQFINGGTP